VEARLFGVLAAKIFVSEGYATMESGIALKNKKLGIHHVYLVENGKDRNDLFFFFHHVCLVRMIEKWKDEKCNLCIAIMPLLNPPPPPPPQKKKKKLCRRAKGK
jgi:hypothetical protein